MKEPTFGSCLVKPKENALFTCEFLGTIEKVNPDGSIRVVDQEGDSFDVDADQITEA